MKPDCLIVSIKIGKCFDDMQKIKKLKFDGDRVELRSKICFLRQSWTKYSEQNRKVQ